MVLTAVVGLLVIGAPPQQTPMQVTIETKVYKVLDEALALEGAKVKKRSAAERSPLVIKFISEISEQNLSDNKGVKLVSAPVVRTLDGMEAKLSIDSTDERQVTVTWKSTMRPRVVRDGKINLEWQVGEESKEDLGRNWGYVHTPLLKDGEPQGLFIDRRGEKVLYIVKARVTNASSKSRLK